MKSPTILAADRVTRASSDAHRPATMARASLRQLKYLAIERLLAMYACFTITRREARPIYAGSPSAGDYFGLALMQASDADARQAAWARYVSSFIV